jgi:defect-in-organelle-trafficking protein DotD
MTIRIHRIYLTVCLILAGCASPPANHNLDPVTTSLAEASYSVSRSIVSLSETAQAAHPLPALEAPPSPASYGMANLTSIDWSGPVEPLVVQLAKAAATPYRVRILGTRPAIPVIVTLYDKNRMVADVLRDVGYQCGRRATLVVYPDSRVIELRYAKN